MAAFQRQSISRYTASGSAAAAGKVRARGRHKARQIVYIHALLLHSHLLNLSGLVPEQSALEKYAVPGRCLSMPKNVIFGRTPFKKCREVQRQCA